ncbi:heavy metal-binding domain-containing protein [Rufibacter aurantiacus]|uniref:heavy metal-binding domain-containing protein n=1 Tax=Rufibacter aurantiacus TaxID=2817374 RepID=UPI001B30033C|nr:heavy metal-binding domain-containing protein [Rufibacter aurantiacus]
MRSLKINIAVAFFGLTLFTACNGSSSEQKAAEGTTTTTEAQVAGVSYTCPMHPEVVSQEKGKCPKCGMFLEEVKPGQKLDSAAAAQQHHEGDQH